MDARGASGASEALRPLEEGRIVVLDLSGVDYLSSAGVRIILRLHKALVERQRKFILTGVQHYCREVLKISGLEGVLDIRHSVEEAMQSQDPQPSRYTNECGSFVFRAGESETASVEIAGHVRDVLESRITVDHLFTKPFSPDDFSIGLGGLGPSREEVIDRLGEMVTVGGTMVWLPTDGSDTPDYLVPRAASDELLIYSGFHVRLEGSFHEYFEFESREGGATLSEVYRALFDRARDMRADFRGAVWLVLRAEMGGVYGSGVLRAPIAANAPANGRPITDSSNFRSWFEFDEEPRHREVTGLLCGMGVDLDADLSHFDRKALDATFYVNPANLASSREMLHNHGVFFTPQPLGERPFNFRAEMERVVDLGDFVDMRHLLDRSTIVWALGAVAYIQDFRKDPQAACRR